MDELYWKNDSRFGLVGMMLFSSVIFGVLCGFMLCFEAIWGALFFQVVFLFFLSGFVMSVGALISLAPNAPVLMTTPSGVMTG